MAKSTPSYLRLYNERDPAAAPPAGAFQGLNRLCRAFENVTGWPLQYADGEARGDETDLWWSAPVDPGVGTAPGHLRIELGESAGPTPTARVDLSAAGELAASIAELLTELAHCGHALWQREAELAAGVPLVPHAEPLRHLAARLEAVLRTGAEVLDCQAAALYLLDDATTELKLRSAWQLPPDRFTAPARPLAEAMADLEALAGHALVVADATKQRLWNLPEPDFAAAVCVPVSSPTVVLGTLWLFATRARPFSDQQVHMAEVVAGRLAADLEREMLLSEGVEAAQVKRQLAAAEALQQNQSPRIAPVVEGWDVAGWSQPVGRVGGDFYDWFVRSDEWLVLAVGDSLAEGFEAAVSINGVRGALRSHAEHIDDPALVLERVNRTLWTSSAGEQAAGVFCGAADRASGRLRYAMAGNVSAILIGGDACEMLSAPSLALGLTPDSHYEFFERLLRPGQAMVVLSGGARTALTGGGLSPGDDALAHVVQQHLDSSASVLADLVRDRLEAQAPVERRQDWTVLVLKRVAR